MSFANAGLHLIGIVAWSAWRGEGKGSDSVDGRACGVGMNGDKYLRFHAVGVSRPLFEGYGIIAGSGHSYLESAFLEFAFQFVGDSEGDIFLA